MKKSRLMTVCIALVLCVVLCVSALAVNLQQISAYLNYDIAIKLDGQEQLMYDANGTRVYPISYEGTTYVPIRAVSNMLGIDVNWDQASYSVLLGKTGEAKDFIVDLEPYYISGFYRSTVEDENPRTIAGKEYTDYIRQNSYSTSACVRYDLGGKYTTLTFKLYSDDGSAGSVKNIRVYGDNDTLLEDFDLVVADLPQTCTVDVTGVTQLSITGSYDYYIIDATIE